MQSVAATGLDSELGLENFRLSQVIPKVTTHENHLTGVDLTRWVDHTQYFNRKYENVGHLLQGRSKAIVCEADENILGTLYSPQSAPAEARKTPIC